MTISEKKRNNKAMSYSIKLSRVDKSKELTPQIFSPADLILEKEKKKGVLPLSNGTYRQRSGDRHGKNSYLLSAFAICPRIF